MLSPKVANTCYKVTCQSELQETSLVSGCLRAARFHEHYSALLLTKVCDQFNYDLFIVVIDVIVMKMQIRVRSKCLLLADCQWVALRLELDFLHGCPALAK